MAFEQLGTQAGFISFRTHLYDSERMTNLPGKIVSTFNYYGHFLRRAGTFSH